MNTVRNVMADIDEILGDPNNNNQSKTDISYIPEMDIDSSPTTRLRSPELPSNQPRDSISETDISDGNMTNEFSLKKKGKLFSISAAEKPDISKSMSFPTDFSDFSSDPITADTFQIKKPKGTLSPLKTARKRAIMATPINEYSHSKAIRLSGKTDKTTTPQKEYSSVKEALLGCRDLLIKAYNRTKNRKTQSDLLDLLDIFIHYTDEGKIQLPITNSIITNVVERNNLDQNIASKVLEPKENESSTANNTVTPTSASMKIAKSLWTTVVRNTNTKK
ncbi:hypothetical protein OnM2_047087, partial [Erysiphe neolycopersici]